jgi:sulfide:quinone oxidoreductase
MIGTAASELRERAANFMKTRVVVLGAGFGGLELSSILSGELDDAVEVTLVDKSDGFVFGFAKIDVLFGKRAPDAVRQPYSKLVKPGVRVVHAEVTSIDPAARRVTTGAGTFDADVLVVALGADLDPAATPGLVESGNEFYTVAGAIKAREALAAFAGGPVVIGAASLPFKCPPAPSETALLLHDFLSARGLRDKSDITLVLPTPVPVPPSPDASKALMAAFAERGIRFVGEAKVASLDAARRVVVLSTGAELPYALFLGVPVHRVPQVVVESGLSAHAQDWIAVDKQTLQTKFPGVYAIGDVSGVGTPKAGVFAEGAARVVAQAIVAKLRGGEPPQPYAGQGSCYVEFGRGLAARVDVDFLSGPKPTSVFQPPSEAIVAEKRVFVSSRVERWF